MSATDTIREMIQTACDAGGELYWHGVSEFDFDDTQEMWATLAIEAEERAAKIREVAGQFPELLGGLTPPRSFVDAAAEFGHFDLFDEDGDGFVYSFSWVEGNLDYGGELTESLFSVPTEWVARHADGKRIAGMCMPDNPGDMPWYMLIGAFDLRTGPDECLWLFHGGDCVWDGGLELVPIGATYHEVIAMLLSGVAAAVFLPPKDCEQALQQLAKTGNRELAASSLAGLSQLCDACADVKLVAEGADGDITLSGQIAKLRPRIAHAVEVLGRSSTLPFGRDPVEVSRHKVDATTREERFVDANPKAVELLEAVGDGDVDRVAELLSEGVDPNTADTAGMTALMHAANAVDYGALETANLLVERGADPTLRDKNGNTALHFAAGCGDAGFAQRLIDAGADVNALDDAGSPPLLNAIENQQTEVLRVLLEAEADPNIENENGWKPFDLAEGFGTPDAVALLTKHGAKRQS